MPHSTEKDLRNALSEKRLLEMERYGRISTYNIISSFLKGNAKEAFSLTNHTLAIIDDELDRNSNKKQLQRAKHLLTEGFYKRKITPTNNLERNILRLGTVLSSLHNGKDIFYEILHYWHIERINITRKGKLLDSHTLDKLNLEIGESVSIQFLLLLCPTLDKKLLKKIASSYGLAIKLADNLSDLNEDLKQGYINISKEDVIQYHLSLQRLSGRGFDLYKKKELKRILSYYQKGDSEVEKVLNNCSSSKGILLFKDIAYSWFRQVSDL